MIDVATLRTIFNEKLAATDSLDAAFTKAVWVAYQAGLTDGAAGCALPAEGVEVLQLCAETNPLGDVRSARISDAAIGLLAP